MRCHVLADNKLALNAGWDEDLLADELGALLSADLDFDVSLTGFSIPEIDSVLQAVAPEEPGDPADDALPSDAPQRVRLGDVWQLGVNRTHAFPRDLLQTLTIDAREGSERMAVGIT